MKSKIFVFISILILVGILFCVASCKNNFLENHATIKINLDLSKIIKNPRNSSSSTEYMLKIFVYDATSFTDGVNIETLPLVAQTENKVDTNGQVKSKVDVEIGLSVIFVAKLFKYEYQNPLYAGKSDVFTVKATDNKVHLVLSNNKAEIGFDVELDEIHEHTFSIEWESNLTHHWHVATCEHIGNVSEFYEHSFSSWNITLQPTEYESGRKERICSVCKYTDIVEIQKNPKDFVFIPSGSFKMGSSAGRENEVPVLDVTITKPFYMGKYEVTQAEWQSIMGSNPSLYQGDNNLPAGGEVQERRPVEQVSWYEIIVYCNMRSFSEGLVPCYSIDGNFNPNAWGEIPTEQNNEKWDAVICDWNANGYRLPTEAEWEYAARAGDKTVDTLIFSGTSDIERLGDYVWYSDNSEGKTHEVGKKLPNAFGLYDMSGNVWEWCWNCSSWNENSNNPYEESEGGDDPRGLDDIYMRRIVRGGSFDCVYGEYYVSYRGSSSTDYFFKNLGFRLVRTITE